MNRKLYILFAILTLLLLMTLGFILFKEMTPEWRRYQEAFFRQEEQKVMQALAQADKKEYKKLEERLRRLRHPRYEIRQILLNGGRHADRCITCHLDLKELEKRHSETQQFSFEEYGCTICHGGVGRATEIARAHSTLRIPRRPLFEYLQAHRTGSFPIDLFIYRADGKRISFTGSDLCLRCHLSSDPRHVARWRKLKFKSLDKVRAKLETLRGKGLTLAEARCLSCHTTGFDEWTDRYQEDRVTCEGCHGPGGFYAELMTGGRARDGAELARALILETRAGQVCLNCHRPDRHRDYEGEDVAPTLIAASLRGMPSPKMDGKLLEEAWGLAPEIKVNTWKSDRGAFVPGAVVFIRALYSDSEVYFSFRWPDKTRQSTMGRWLFRNGQWQAEVTWPDALALHWQATAGVDDFGQGGCAVLCHTTGRFTEFPRMAVREEGALVDEWYWNAYLAAKAGRPGDGFLDHRVEFIPPGTKTAAFGWAPPGSSGAHASDTSGKRVPQTVGGVPLILNAKEIVGKPLLPQYDVEGGEAVPLQPAESTKLQETALPLYLPGRPEEGDSADIRGEASWSGGYWTLELSRPLRTFHKRDVQFDPTAKDYSFGLAVWDGAAGDQHQTATIARLRFESAADDR